MAKVLFRLVAPKEKEEAVKVEVPPAMEPKDSEEFFRPLPKVKEGVLEVVEEEEEEEEEAAAAAEEVDDPNEKEGQAGAALLEDPNIEEVVVVEEEEEAAAAATGLAPKLKAGKAGLAAAGAVDDTAGVEVVVAATELEVVDGVEEGEEEAVVAVVALAAGVVGAVAVAAAPFLRTLKIFLLAIFSAEAFFQVPVSVVEDSSSSGSNDVIWRSFFRFIAGVVGLV